MAVGRVTGYHEVDDRCIRDDTWSYVRRPSGEPDELYNLVDDPRERTNLIGRHPEEARRLADAFGPYFQLQSHRGISETEVKGIQGKYELASGGIF